MRLTTPLVALLCVLVAASASASDVKLSRSGICHAPDTAFYSKTTRYTAYPTLAACQAAGGRLPYGTAAVPATRTTTPASAPPAALQRHVHAYAATHTTIPPYDRDAFRHWIDTDRDCLNTRHELLQALSVSTVDHGRNKCTVARGRWFDPYTARYFYNASDVEIDHVVPLHWAWQHGAWQWDDQQREIFANDTRNLLVVSAVHNREKGAHSPLEWLPPDRGYHCQYVTHFKRVVSLYKLSLSAREAQALDAQRAQLCAR